MGGESREPRTENETLNKKRLSMPADKVQILNLNIDNYTFREFLENLDSGVVFTPNVDHLMKLQKDREFYEVYTAADHLVCDSQIVKVSSKWLPQAPIREQIAGSDLFPAFCQFHRNNTDRIRVFLLGGTRPEDTDTAWRNINSKAGSEVVIGGYCPPFGFEKNAREEEHIINLINESGATVLAVGVGAPKQEKWIIRNKHRMPNIRIFFAIGATIDFLAGNVQRSPKWITRIGLEWAFRMAQEPKRMFKRYMIDDMPYFWLIFKQRLGRYQNPWA